MNSVYLDAKRLALYIEGEYAKALQSFDVSPLEAHVLNVLHEDGAMRASELASRVGRAAANFTATLDHLQERGFLERKSHPADRRSVLITLTDNGNALFPALCEALAAAHDKTCLSFFKVGQPARKFVERYTTLGKPY